MSGRRLFWVGGYTQADAAALTAYHNDLQAQFGFVPVGAPVFRAYGGNACAFAAFEQGVFTIIVLPGVINISAWIRTVPADLTPLKQLTVTTFGLGAGGTLEEGDDTINIGAP